MEPGRPGPTFHIASPEEIRSGKVTDVYFERGREVLEDEGENPEVVAEVRTTGLPDDWPWAIFAGLEEAVALLHGRDVEVRAIPEGSLFLPEEPVLTVEGRYLEFGVLETALLGVLCQASGVATRAARCKVASEGRPVYSFGARRMHPATAPMIERGAYVGGCDGVAAVKSAELLEIEPIGTMAHALILILGEERAYRAFDRVIDPEVPRVALIDTFHDEKFGALSAAKILGERLSAVRLDTPGSRRGDFAAILREVRWELDAAGFQDVKIFVSGGIDEKRIRELVPLADAFGVGTWISSGAVVDFSLDIVEVDGEPRAKRGKLSGRKSLWRCSSCGHRDFTPGREPLQECPRCGGPVRSLFETWLSRGKPIRELPPASAVRAWALQEAAAAADPFTPGG